MNKIKAEMREEGGYVPFSVLSESPLKVAFIFKSVEKNGDWSPVGVTQVIPNTPEPSASYDLFTCNIPNSRTKTCMPVKQDIKKVRNSHDGSLTFELSASLFQPEASILSIIGSNVKTLFYDAENTVESSGSFSLGYQTTVADVEDYLRENL